MMQLVIFTTITILAFRNMVHAVAVKSRIPKV
jgi:hypothetical protein